MIDRVESDIVVSVACRPTKLVISWIARYEHCKYLFVTVIHTSASVRLNLGIFLFVCVCFYSSMFLANVLRYVRYMLSAVRLLSVCCL